MCLTKFKLFYEGVIHLDYFRICNKTQVHERKIATSLQELCTFCIKLQRIIRDFVGAKINIKNFNVFSYLTAINKQMQVLCRSV